MEKANAINFLLYSYFGVTLEDEEDKIIKSAIMRAYDDATMQGAYNSLFKKESPNIDDLKNKSYNARKNSAKLLFCGIKKHFPQSKKEYKIWHKKICEKITSFYEAVKISESSFFSYGNAQKWVNMTIKYLCIFASISDRFSLKKQIETLESVFHIPVDSYIIEALWNEGKRENKDACIEEKESSLIVVIPCKKGARIKKYNSDKITPWSKWEQADYDKFQETLFDSGLIKKEFPLDWETETWIDTAKKRKSKDRMKYECKFFEPLDIKTE